MPVPNIEEFARQMQGITLVTTHNQQRANRMAKPEKDGDPAPMIRIPDPNTPPIREEQPEEHPKSEMPTEAPLQTDAVVPIQKQETPQKESAVLQGRSRLDRRMLRRAVILSEIIGPPKSRRR